MGSSGGGGSSSSNSKSISFIMFMEKYNEIAQFYSTRKSVL